MILQVSDITNGMAINPVEPYYTMYNEVTSDLFSQKLNGSKAVTVDYVTMDVEKSSCKRSLGKEVMMDFENSAVCLPSNEGGLENTLMESRSFRNDLYGSLFQQSGSVETQAPCDPFSFNNGGVTTSFVHTLSTPATEYVQLIGLQSADPQSRPFIAANHEGKHFSSLIPF
ncbi:hypothetical protein Tco_1397585 [Tanacetum coccineum]